MILIARTKRITSYWCVLLPSIKATQFKSVDLKTDQLEYMAPEFGFKKLVHRQRKVRVGHVDKISG